MHVSLDSALGRQRRLNSVGESVLQIAPNAAAAYSLRSLTGGDPTVVRVRRGSDNHEQDFTVSEVSAGALTSFVNAQVVAPLDIQALEADGRTGDFLIAKAAYSLRSLGTRQATVTSSGDTAGDTSGKFVAQVRRSSDDAVKSFTADEITDGTLVSFVTQEVEGYKNNPTYVKNFGTGDISNVTTTSFDIDAGSTGNLYVFASTSGQVIEFGIGDIVELNLSVTGLTVAGRLILYKTGTGNVASATNHTFSNGDNQTVSAVATAAGGHIGFGTLRSPDGGSITINSVKVIGQSGFVKTWYDQSVTNEAGDTATGNHATQATAASQPKIVSAGALVTVGVDFTDGKSMDFTSISAKTVVAVNQLTSTSGFNYLIGKSTADDGVRTGSGNGLFQGADTATTGNADDFNGAGGTTHMNGSQSSFLATSKNVYFGTATSGFSLTSLSTAFAPGGTSRAWKGKIAEAILYDTDQTDNRTAIEANIGEVYSIDLPSGVDPGFDQVDGFVETWYDQSGNGKDAVQATAGSQPKIVDGGSLVALSGIPAISFDGSDLFTATGFAFSPAGDFLAVTVSKISTGQLFDTRDGVSDGFFINQGGSDFKYRYNGDGSIDVSGNNQHIIATAELDGTTLTAYKNGSSAGTDTVTAGLSTTQEITIGRVSFTSANFIQGSVQEIILYDTDQSANRVALETNINSQYSIF